MFKEARDDVQKIVDGILVVTAAEQIIKKDDEAGARQVGDGKKE
jgi:hypothetical protein